MNYYLDKMDHNAVKNACQVAHMPKETIDWIFEPDYIKNNKVAVQKIKVK